MNTTTIYATILCEYAALACGITAALSAWSNR